MTYCTEHQSSGKTVSVDSGLSEDHVGLLSACSGGKLPPLAERSDLGSLEAEFLPYKGVGSTVATNGTQLLQGINIK